ncbi:protein of unknown function [Candidatus Nitrotoga arctica]|uniref:Uncharacterized protein n=1 Tax=Candidatus Nitrotoga arctica TaxID=453162 RepID=A0ABM8YXP4_9PROT|nr:protein of unknown function [Candidatus Nitrotoga arctica]
MNARVTNEIPLLNSRGEIGKKTFILQIGKLQYMAILTGAVS